MLEVSSGVEIKGCCNMEAREEESGVGQVDVNLWKEYSRQHTGRCKGPEAGACLLV